MTVLIPRMFKLTNMKSNLRKIEKIQHQAFKRSDEGFSVLKIKRLTLEKITKIEDTKF